MSRIYLAFSVCTIFQGNQIVDKKKFFIEEFQPVNAEGMIKNHYFATPTEQ